ncbi:MAG: DUF805 domain-containing protein [Alistipes sp.]|nr:DUF805 domain-containing protein [Alistipes sp.]
MIPFTEAIKRGFKKAFDFSGRATRAEYWWWCLAHFSSIILFAAIIFSIIVSLESELLMGISLGFFFIVYLGLLMPTFALTVRRLHDAGHSGWWVLGTIIASILSIVIIEYGLAYEMSDNQINVVYLICSCPMLWMLVEGSGPDNKYGANPHTKPTNNESNED